MTIVTNCLSDASPKDLRPKRKGKGKGKIVEQKLSCFRVPGTSFYELEGAPRHYQPDQGLGTQQPNAQLDHTESIFHVALAW